MIVDITIVTKTSVSTRSVAANYVTSSTSFSVKKLPVNLRQYDFGGLLFKDDAHGASKCLQFSDKHAPWKV